MVEIRNYPAKNGDAFLVRAARSYIESFCSRVFGEAG
jgi:hypothetical protein